MDFLFSVLVGISVIKNCFFPGNLISSVLLQMAVNSIIFVYFLFLNCWLVSQYISSRKFGSWWYRYIYIYIVNNFLMFLFCLWFQFAKLCFQCTVSPFLMTKPIPNFLKSFCIFSEKVRCVQYDEEASRAKSKSKRNQTPYSGVHFMS